MTRSDELWRWRHWSCTARPTAPRRPLLLASYPPHLADTVVASSPTRIIHSATSGTGHYYFGMPRTTRSSPTRTGRSGKPMYQADALGLFKVVSVTTWGHILDAIVSRAYEQVGDDHAPGPVARA
jgi:hypothetical protein